MKPSKSREPMRRLWCLAWPAVAVAASVAAAGEDRRPPIELPFALPEVRRPTFADARFPITDYGARRNDDSNVSGAIAAAVEACAMAGGGHVVVPPGRWRSGPIHLRSGVVLHLEEGATIRFSDRFEDYLPPVFVRHAGIEIYNYSPLVYARDCVNVGVTGRGGAGGQRRTLVGLEEKGDPQAVRTLGRRPGARAGFRDRAGRHSAELHGVRGL
jgi:hypothetical protein